MLHWLHVPMIVQCQSNLRSLISKDSAVIQGLLDKQQQVISPFWKWRLMIAAAPILLSILDLSVYTSSCSIWLLQYSLNLTWSSCLEITHLLTPSMRLYLAGSYSCVPSGKLGCLKGQLKSLLFSADVTAASTLRPMGRVGGPVMPPCPFVLGSFRSLVAWSKLCRAWCAGFSMQAHVLRY